MEKLKKNKKKTDIYFFRLYQKNIKQLQKFIDKHWQKNHIFAIDEKVFNWQYKRNGIYNFFIAKKGNNLIGVQGLIPLNHFDKNLKTKQIFLTFWRVIEGKHVGIGFKLQKKIYKKYKPEFIGVVGAHKKVHSFFKWQGFTVKKMNHHVVISKNAKEFKIAKVNKFKVLYKKYIKNLSLVNINSKNIKSLLNNKFYNVQKPLKTNNYIINRYLKHPFYKYLVFLIMNKKKPKALMIIRPVKIDKSLVLRFVDFIGTSESFLYTYHASNLLLDRYKAEYVDIYSYGIPKKIFKKAGYTDRYVEKDMIIPSNFEPFERKNVDIFCAFKTNFSNKEIKLFKGDGDGDRPNALAEQNYKFL